ncbi:MAG: helix-turn-helix transcriptional regulator [Chloroflexota bacterium]
MSLQVQITLRTRMLGVLLRDARIAARKTFPDLNKDLGISTALIKSYEEGRKSPSLPELEVLAYYFKLPIRHFWSSEALSDNSPLIEPINLPQLVNLRQRMIGTLLRHKRQQTEISVKELSSQTGIPQTRLNAYELGENPIPISELEAILPIIGQKIEIFYDQNGPVGRWMRSESYVQKFLDLPSDLQAFICLPGNQVYLELARQLSELPIEKINTVAQSLHELVNLQK